jgi:hypothetical protein
MPTTVDAGVRPDESEFASAKMKPVFLSWSGRGSSRTALALAALLQDVFGEDVAWHSQRSLTGIQTWREEIRAGVDSAKMIVVSLGLRSLYSRWLIYETGAFLPKGRTFLLGCGAGKRALEKTPLRELQVFDACSRPAVHQMVSSIGRVLGRVPTDFEKRFAAAWPAFSRKATRARNSARAQRFAAAVTVPALLAAYYFWAQVFCVMPFVGPTACADATWAQFVDWKRTESGKRVDKLISRRPFAVITMRSTCSDATAQRPTIVWPGMTFEKFPDVSLPVVFAPSGFETNTNYDPALVFERGPDATYIQALHTCVPLKPLNGGSTPAAATVMYVGTLSNDKLCEKVQELGPHFGSNAPLVEELSKFLATFAIGEPDALLPVVTEWVKSCRPSVEARHASATAAASTPTP